MVEVVDDDEVGPPVVVDVVLDPSGSSAVDEVVVDEASLGATVASGSTIPVTTAWINSNQ